MNGVSKGGFLMIHTDISIVAILRFSMTLSLLIGFSHTVSAGYMHHQDSIVAKSVEQPSKVKAPVQEIPAIESGHKKIYLPKELRGKDLDVGEATILAVETT